MIKLAAIKILSRLAWRAYQRDRSNRYELKRDWKFVFYSDPQPPAPYVGRLLWIDPLPAGSPRPGAKITVLAPGECDGASFAPDSPPGAIEASIAHDPLYAEMRFIARHWRRHDNAWNFAAVRRWSDGVLAAIMSHYGSHGLRHAYYRGVRWFGAIFNRIKHFLPLLPLLILPIIIVACDVPDADDIHVPDDPIWEKVAVLSDSQNQQSKIENW